MAQTPDDIRDTITHLRDTLNRAKSFINAFQKQYDLDPDETIIKQKVDGNVVSSVSLAELISDLDDVSSKFRKLRQDLGIE